MNPANQSNQSILPSSVQQHMHPSMQHVTLTPHQASAHLTPDVWHQANRLLLRKALSEYAHELIIEPQRIGNAPGEHHARFQVRSDDGTRTYTFEARELALRHWSIRPESIECTHDGVQQPLDTLAFILDVKNRLGIKEEMLPIYLDEISSTLYGAAYKIVKEGPDTEDLLNADFQDFETAMSEGHPGFVANNGRLGFDAGDYRAFAPESGSPIQIVWLAVHKDNAAFHASEDLDYTRLMNEELGQPAIQRFRKMVEARDCQFDDYHLMPAHPWQWFNKLSIAFASYVATNRIICLGYGEDRYIAQQSIRTFFNASDNTKRYVKTSLSILNMGFMRGLSPYYMSGTPAINDYIKGLVESDPYLAGKGFTILREVASLGFRNHYYEAAVQVDSPYKKMFSALWRENPLTHLRKGQRLMTMAALLHSDRNGCALLPALIKSSGLTTLAWLERYMDAYLAPLMHCFYAYDLVFMPHGENLILVLEDGVPVRAIMKDIAEESAILNKDASLPENVKRLAVDVPERVKLLAIFIDVFDGFFRYVNQILVEHDCCTEDQFWDTVAGCIARHQAAHPQLASKYAQYDIFAPAFLHSCLNRLQLANNLQMVNLSDPAENLKMAGNLRNPLAGRRPAARETNERSLALTSEA